METFRFTNKHAHLNKVQYTFSARSSNLSKIVKSTNSPTKIKSQAQIAQENYKQESQKCKGLKN